MLYILDKSNYDLARLYRINIIGCYFVIRQKSHINYEIVDGKDPLDDTGNVRHDQMIHITGNQTKMKYSGTFVSELQMTFTFLINNIALKASDIASLYKQRW